MEEGVASTIKHLEEHVNALYNFRDSYFESHGAEEAHNKWKEVEAELAKVLNVFQQSRTLRATEKAAYFYLLGRALNVSKNYNPEAEEVLSRAIKLDVKLYQAWNELGEAYCKKKDFMEARNCFVGALEQQKNKESLRNLSILMRRKEFWNLADGMKYAKEAVELDAKDGESWLVLGNAYISLYGVKQNPKILDLCKSAYSIAQRDQRLANDPFLHYNRGIIEKLQDDYESALLSFEKAQMLDPTWREAQTERAELIEYLDKAQSFVDEKGKLKGKKLKKLMRTINPGLHSGRSKRRKQVYLRDMKKDVNKGAIVFGIAAATFSDELRFNVVLVDVQESSAVVNIYNLPEETGILVGSIVAIPDPWVKRVRITGKGRNYFFDSIRVENPSAIIVNGKAMKAMKRRLCFTTTTTPH